MDKWISGLQSVGFARQTDYVTENSTNGDFHYFPAEVDVPALVRATEEFQAATGQIGAQEPPVAGSKHGGTFTVKLPFQGFKSGYDPVTGPGMEPGQSVGVTPPSLILFANALGSASESAAITNAVTFMTGKGLACSDFTASTYADTYAPNAVVSTAIVGGKTTVTVGAGKGAEFKVGQLVYFGADLTDTAPAVGWIESIAADTLTLSETCANAPVANDESFASGVAFLSDDKPQPLTFRFLGAELKQKLVLIGCICTGGKLTMVAGKTPMVELKYTFTDHTWSGSGGGLQPPSGTFLRIQPVLGTNAGRLTYGASGAGGAIVTGFSELELAWENTVAYVPSHSSAQGVAEGITTDRKVTLTCKVPWSEADAIASGETVYGAAFVAGTAKSLNLYCGVVPGRVLAVYLPSVHLAAQPTLEAIDGLFYHNLQFRPGRFAGDGASTNAGNSVLRVGVV